MTNQIPKEEWVEYLNSVSKRMNGWETKIEVMNEELGDQVLEDGLPFIGITAELRGEKAVVDISVGKDAGHHQTHSIVSPSAISFMSLGEKDGGVFEVMEGDGTTTLIHVSKPVPVGSLGAGSDSAKAGATFNSDRG